MKAASVKLDETRVGKRTMNLGTDCGYWQLMSDLFHDSSQPLSTLGCMLENQLLVSRAPKQWRDDLRVGLKLVRSLVCFFHALRELCEAGTAHQDAEVLSVAVCLRGVVADLLPVAEEAKIKIFVVSSSDCPVTFQASRLRQGLTHLVDFAIQSSAPGAEVKITADEEDEAARVTVAISMVAVSSREDQAGGSTAEGKQRDLKRRLGLAVAWRVFESAGGSLQSEYSQDRLRLEACLPLASAPNFRWGHV